MFSELNLINTYNNYHYDCKLKLPVPEFCLGHQGGKKFTLQVVIKKAWETLICQSEFKPP